MNSFLIKNNEFILLNKVRSITDLIKKTCLDIDYDQIYLLVCLLKSKNCSSI